MKKLTCCCPEEGCLCVHEISVPNPVSDDSIVICSDCSNGNHTINKKQLRSTNIKRVRKDMFVQNG